MKRFLVTGGAGFIGSHLCEILNKGGHQVDVVDSFDDYGIEQDAVTGRIYQERIDGVRKHARLIRGRVEEPFTVLNVLRDGPYDAVIHLAGMAIAKTSQHHPDEALSSILMSTYNTLSCLKYCRHQATRFVYISSSMVYGDFVQTPAVEDMATFPKEIYGAAKLGGEAMVRAFTHQFDMEHTIVRPSAVYGPRDANRRVVQALLMNALAGQKLKITGSSTMLDLTYVTDLAEGIVLLAQSEGARNQTFNLTRGQARSLGELGKIVAACVPGCALEDVGEEQRRPRRGTLSIEKARALGYSPQYDLERGVAEYAEDLRRYYR